MDWGSLVRYVQDSVSNCIDYVLPPRRTTRRTKHLTLSHVPLVVASHRLLGTEITTIMDYQNPAVHDLIQSLKYDGSGYAAQLCAEVLADYLREEIATSRIFSPRLVILIPLPLHVSRKRERGFNQMESVLKRLPQEFKNNMLSSVNTKTLVRIRATKQQAKLTRDARIRNVRGAFVVPNAKELRDAHVFLIDDVTTTGSTLASAGDALRESGAEVTLVALARA